MRIYALGTVESGHDLLELLRGRVSLAGIIGLGERRACDGISGYIHMRPLAERLGVDFVSVDSYALSGAEDRKKLEALDIDVLLVVGWQRLVPQWLIDRCRFGAIGAHGSPNGISGGRGRSPQNWSLILGAKTFSISIFFIDAGIDSGRVIDTRAFPYEDGDDIASSYAKVMLLTADMIANAFAGGAITAGRATPQTGDAFYLPQRLPEDGGIDWRRSARDVCRFVAALTRPYPGAFTDLRGTRITVWRARPLDIGRPAAGRPGQILLNSAGGRIIVVAGDGLVLIDDFETEPGPAPAPGAGEVFASADFQAQMTAIIDRHRLRYPGHPLSADILALRGAVLAD
jgi:UDP-4-amino-4-deoxy-L-arabinose formyltransferase/UDP-glucuronic acid dehydrogenase (UDP-4-keto-hexauronic acid decarboxylating)